VVVGAGPNGLAAAVTLARAGRSVVLLEAGDTVGGGSRTAELTLPGFRHDVCSSVHPLGAASPLFRSLDLDDRGLAWVHPDAPLAHPLDDGTVAVLERSVEGTAAGLGPDGPAYRSVFEPSAQLLGRILDEGLDGHPGRRAVAVGLGSMLSSARLGLLGLSSVSALVRGRFGTAGTAALLAGIAAHSSLPLDRRPTGGYAMALATLGHVAGWPFAGGGSQAIADALAGCLGDAGGEIRTGVRVASLDDAPAAREIVLDLTPAQVLRLAGDRLSARSGTALRRYRYGPGACKVDWALDGPIPWRSDECSRAGTVHLGGTLEEIAAGESAVWRGEHAARPFVLVAQATPFDPSRAPDRQHTAWAYCHVPNGSTVDVTAQIEAQVERFAPGFGDRILGRAVSTAADLERYNENYVGGDIAGGARDLAQLPVRPALATSPYHLGDGLWMCSSATPPGAGVHGMCGYLAAQSVLRRDPEG